MLLPKRATDVKLPYQQSLIVFSYVRDLKTKVYFCVPTNIYNFSFCVWCCLWCARERASWVRVGRGGSAGFFRPRRTAIRAPGDTRRLPLAGVMSQTRNSLSLSPMYIRLRALNASERASNSGALFVSTPSAARSFARSLSLSRAVGRRHFLRSASSSLPRIFSPAALFAPTKMRPLPLLRAPRVTRRERVLTKNIRDEMRIQKKIRQWNALLWIYFSQCSTFTHSKNLFTLDNSYHSIQWIYFISSSSFSCLMQKAYKFKTWIYRHTQNRIYQ